MVRRIAYVVFVLPILFSIVFGSVVMADVLREPERELNMWPVNFSDAGITHNEFIEVIGLQKQYTTSQPVQVTISINDPSFDCGDLYVIIYSGSNVISQSGFFEQCFVQKNEILPIGADFSEIIDIPGQYELVVEMKDKTQTNNISASGKFTVK